MFENTNGAAPKGCSSVTGVVNHSPHSLSKVRRFKKSVSKHASSS